jgi:4-amino-4-deoxy-L-arabinose transferase-like glycosyltransferase
MSRLSPRGWFLVALAATLAFRFWLAAALPITADEAYFVLWGRQPDLGFYDHPPMIGWWLAPLVALSDADWVARLPATLAPAAVALALRAALLGWFASGEDSANLAAAAVLLAPINLWNVLITTDAPLLVFSVASLLVFLRAIQSASGTLFFAAGVLLGFAFLSKYFAVLLGLGYLGWALLAGRWAAAGLVVAGALPAGLLNLWWNVNACWSNVMFNAINRHDDGGWSLATPALYAGALAYLAAPLLWFLWCARAQVLGPGAQSAQRALAVVWLLPLALFALLSPVKRIGLHWLQWLVPALVIALVLAGTREQLRTVVRFFAAFALLHVGLAAAVALTPLEVWKDTRSYSRLVFLAEGPALVAALAPQLDGYALAADSYSAAALLAYHTRGAVPVFGPGSSHARHDDILTDWRRYDGRDLLILRRERPPIEDYRRYFRELDIAPLEFAGATFYAVRGRGFDYAAYHEHVLAGVRERYYRIPQFLPTGRCYFFERYFPG